MKHKLLLWLLFAITLSYAQNKKTLTLEDATLGYWKGLYPEKLQGLQWATDSNTFAYINNNEIVYTDAKSNEKLSSYKLEDLQKIYPQLQRFPFSIKNINADGFSFQDNDKLEILNIHHKSAQQITVEQKAENSDYSSDANAIAYTIDNNLYIATEDNSKLTVTNHTNKNIVAGQAIARSEYGISKGTFWSPNGNYLAFYQKNEINVTEYPLVDITTYPATEKPIKYPMAGQGSEIPSVGVYNMKTKEVTYLNIDGTDNHYVTNLSWSPDEKYILIAELNRATTSYDLNLYDAISGDKIRTIITETNNVWVEPEHSAVFLPKSNSKFIWLSEKDGFMNLYLHDIYGKTNKQITHFDWVVKDILGFDSNGNYAYISGTGKDARNTHTFKVNLKNGKTTQLTKEDGTHHSMLSHDGTYLLDSYSSISVPNITQIINTKTGKSIVLHKADNPLKDYKIGTQEFVNLKANNGTLLHGILMKPENFDPNKKYPVLVYVYGGPHAQLVTNSYLGGASMWLPAFAALHDYIVFTLDNRGSANRGFQFESGIHRQLGELEMQDQLTGVNYLKSLPYIDQDRMAINGWSFGGFMTTSMMLRHPGIFTTAVAGGPVIDWKYYEVMYGERYMDTPQENPEGYEKAKVSNYITNLKGNLLLITGSVDPVVVPQHSMSLLKAAIDNNVQVDFFSYPMHEHNVLGRDRVHLIEKMAKYIVEHNK